jgi:hypothetical protein
MRGTTMVLMSHVTSARSPAQEQVRAHLATVAAAALIMLAVVAAALALAVGDGAADATQPADTGQARFGGYEAGIAAVVAARRPARPDETRVAAAIAGK